MVFESEELSVQICCDVFAKDLNKDFNLVWLFAHFQAEKKRLNRDRK